jgi:hypothetical protein
MLPAEVPLDPSTDVRGGWMKWPLVRRPTLEDLMETARKFATEDEALTWIIGAGDSPEARVVAGAWGLDWDEDIVPQLEALRRTEAGPGAGETLKERGRRIEAAKEPKPRSLIAEAPRFDERDHAPEPKAPMTLDEREALFEEMVDLWAKEPMTYVTKRQWAAAELGMPQKTIDAEVKVRRDRRKEQGDAEQSQATKAIAIGMGKDVRLWHSSMGNGYASVRAGQHWENYRLRSTGFERWLRGEYGKQNQVKIGDRWVWQVPGTQALKDAMATLESYARHQGAELEPAIRVGGDRKVIWIDLGGADWRAVKVTAEGWEVVSRSDVAFIRTGTMLALPEPARGGDVLALRGLLNVRDEEFVLVAGWMLQALNPVGPYPFIEAYGEAEMGKTTFCRMVLRTVDPSSAGLRKVRKIEDILIAAKNNWITGYDNISWMSKDMSDTLCMLATGIAVGGRQLYTDDEEHVFMVQRPIVFNGIPGDLIERADLASRVIKFHLPPLAKRRTEADLEAEFTEVWPGVFGALLDGLVAGLRDGPGVEVPDPARLMDFERFAEAGCRKMGFEEWEFADAYAANRAGALAIVAEANPVARAIIKYIKGSKSGCFAGTMTRLYTKLESFKEMLGISGRDWPKSPTKLSSELARVRKPLAAVGIVCEIGVDRRSEGGTQRDVVITRRDGD